MKQLTRPRLFKHKPPAAPAGQHSPAGGGLGRPPRVILNTILIFLASQLAAAFMVEFIYALVTRNGRPGLTQSVPAQFFYVLIAEGLAAWLAIKGVKRRGLSLGFIGLGRKPRLKDALGAAVGFGAFYGLLIIAGIIINIFSPNINNEQQNIGFENIRTGSESLMAFISLVLIPPLGEETLIRGYLYSGLRKFWRFWPALLVTSVIFGLAHLELGSGGPLVWAAAIDTFLLSIVLVFLRERTGALYAGILVHMLNNMIAFFIHFK